MQNVNDEFITLENEDPGSWICICGNTTFQEGFFPCNEKGHELEPTVESGWENLYVCDQCGRIIQQHTLQVLGFRDRDGTV